LAFTPALQGGATNLQAGAFTNFALQITRPDGDQTLKSVAVTLPPGDAAILASLTPCPEPEASLGTCGPESEIGQASATSGVGPDPYTVSGGRVFITGPYDGAPFGLAILTPAVAGPFDLGEILVRSRIDINPNTAAVTITSGLPTFVQGLGRAPTGIPLQLRQINVSIDRPNFEFNPTNCTPMNIQGTLEGAEGTTANATSPFQVAGCQSLPFDPKLTATAAGKGSKANGTSLKVTVTSGGINASGAAQAGIAKVDLQLPKALSSRLPTLQKACTEQIFNANPASCDEGSVIGNATIHTPVLKDPLSGPAYLVSHGGAEFPDVEFVLQGEGITLVLDGKTDIKDGVTYSRFESTPDAPFTVFETDLPAGPHSVLTPNVPEKDDFSLCKASLSMPTEITGQNGAVINQTTKIAISGCNGVLPSKTIKPTKAQLLAKALKACRKDKHKHKRTACEKQARRKYETKTPKKKTTKKQ
jgi:phage tail protein X